MRRQTRRRVLTALRQDAALQILKTELGHCLGPGLDCLAIAICRTSCIAVKNSLEFLSSGLPANAMKRPSSLCMLTRLKVQGCIVEMLTLNRNCWQSTARAAKADQEAAR